MDQAGLTLYTFAMSHYSEKVRWALSACRLPFREVVMTPAMHLLPAMRMGGRGRTTLPILSELRLNGEVSHIQDSTRILLWLDDRHGPLDILPQGTQLRGECLDIEQRFDAIGRDIARCLYADAFDDDAHVLGLWTQHASPLQARMLGYLYPLIKLGTRLRLDTSRIRVARSVQRIQQALAWLEGRISDGRLYLVGSRLTVADITAAALLAPLACPHQHPVFGTADYVERFRSRGGPLRLDRPAMVWVRKLYDLHRGALELPLPRAA